MKPLNIYCAGKITKNGWRNHFASGVDFQNAEWDTELWPVTQGTVFGHNYVGPYFISDDHGCFHGRSTHGVAAGKEWCCGEEDPLKKRRVFDLCLDAIARCDVLYAWIDSKTCYGTITEIGWAAAKGKRIVIAGPYQPSDLWFVYQMSSEPFLLIENPIDGLEKFVAPVDYHAYIASDAWKKKAKLAKERASNRCQLCNKPSTETTLDAHHRTYERLGRELDTDITVLCRGCHAKFHNKPVRS